MREGWICPSCKRGVSPDHKYCDHSGQLFIHPYLNQMQNQQLSQMQISPLSQMQGPIAGAYFGVSQTSKNEGAN